MSVPKSNIIVIGAGVTGLTCALLLVEAGHRVSIVAAHVPGDEHIEYASPWAGGHWRTHASADETRLCDWDVQTYDHWLRVMEQERLDAGREKSGLKMYDQFHFWDQALTEPLWWAPYVQDFASLSALSEPMRTINQKSPAGGPRVQEGAVCRSMTINVPRYLAYLQNQLSRAGVIVFKAKLPTGNGLLQTLSAAENVAGHGADCYVNATGLSALKICGDDNMYPIRGQTVLVRGEADAIRIRKGDGYMVYCLPRAGSGTTILGGTNQVGDWTASAVPETTKEILERCSRMVPELQTAPDGGFDVISSQCGLRPARKGGPRVEREVVGAAKIVHAYGHGGAGYQNSMGCAREVLRLVEESIKSSPRL